MLGNRFLKGQSLFEAVLIEGFLTKVLQKKPPKKGPEKKKGPWEMHQGEETPSWYALWIIFDYC